MRKPQTVGYLLAALLLVAGLASCQQNRASEGDLEASESQYDEQTLLAEDEASKVATASSVVSEAVEAGDSGIPQALLENAYGIAVIPNVVKGALGIGGRWGKGLVSQRLANGEWSAPVNISMGGVSYGFQAGVSSTDLVLVFTDPKGVSHILGDGLKLGADVEVTAGPIGRSAEIGTNARLGTAVYSYSRSEGLFAGAALDGAVIEVDQTANSEMYGRDVDASSLLNGSIKPPIGLKPFIDALEVHVPPTPRS
jgi:lipid-binding SYLF domain-containing protein